MKGTSDPIRFDVTKSNGKQLGFFTRYI